MYEEHAEEPERLPEEPEVKEAEFSDAVPAPDEDFEVLEAGDAQQPWYKQMSHNTVIRYLFAAAAVITAVGTVASACGVPTP